MFVLHSLRSFTYICVEYLQKSKVKNTLNYIKSMSECTELYQKVCKNTYSDMKSMSERTE